MKFRTNATITEPNRVQVGGIRRAMPVDVPVARGFGLAVVPLELLAHALQVLHHQILAGKLVVVREVVQPLVVVHLVHSSGAQAR